MKKLQTDGQISKIERLLFDGLILTVVLLLPIASVILLIIFS